MNGVRDNLDNLKFSVDAQVITLHDVDAIQLAIDLSRVQMFYQMALASAGKLLSLSLLDFI